MKKHLEHLSRLMSDFGLPKKYFLQTADARIGKKLALASWGPNKSLNIHSDWLTPKEMESYFKGWYDKKMKKI